MCFGTDESVGSSIIIIPPNPLSTLKRERLRITTSQPKL